MLLTLYGRFEPDDDDVADDDAGAAVCWEAWMLLTMSMMMSLI